MTEPPDHHTYSLVLFYKDTFDFYLRAVRFYESILEKDLTAIEADEDLRELLGRPEQHRFAIHDELDHVRGVREWMEGYVATEDGHFGYHVSVSHGWVRLVKSACQLYVKHLKHRRNILATKPVLSQFALAAVDQQVSGLEEKIHTGVFKEATPRPLLVDEVLEGPAVGASPGSGAEPLATAERPRPVLLGSIEIFDVDVRARCLDLFDKFRQEGQHERLDTVVTESTRILEDRLRELTGAPDTVTGVELATYAFRGHPPRIVLSAVDAEQEAAHLLFRGVFGFIRNRVHHRLVADLKPERVLQIVGMIDYLLSLIEGHSQTETSDDGSAA